MMLDARPNFKLTEEAIALGIRLAIHKAQALQRPVIFSYSQNWTQDCCVDPLTFLAAYNQVCKNSYKEYKFHWEQPDLNLTLTAAGAAAVISDQAIAKNRFDLAQQFTEDYVKDAVTVGDTDLGKIPLHILGGFAFHDRHTDLNWEGFPDVMMFIPRWLIQQKSTDLGKFCVITINYGVNPETEPEQIEANLEQILAELSRIEKYGHVQNLELTSEISLIEEVMGSTSRPWTEIVEEAVSLIKLGNLDKVVLARALDVYSHTNFSPTQVLNSLRHSYPECISFLIDLGIGSTFIGATPEILLQFQFIDGYLALRSDAIAGSTRRGLSISEDQLLGDILLKSPKDQYEHEIVIKSICDRFQALGANISQLQPPKLKRLKNVQHLYTAITAKLPVKNWLSAFNILRDLHPTAAVGGEPKAIALNLMQNWEICDRGWYAAPIGWVNANGEGAFAVGIRSGYLNGDRARIYAGAGIVADSDITSELGETAIKFEALLKSLGAKD